MTKQIPVTRELLSATEAYAKDVLLNHLPKEYGYHTIDHTVQVVEAAEKIGLETGLDENQVMLIKMAAWLHDLGYVNKYEGHEEEGIKMAEAFLQSVEAEPTLIKRIGELNYAT